MLRHPRTAIQKSALVAFLLLAATFTDPMIAYVSADDPLFRRSTGRFEADTPPTYLIIAPDRFLNSALALQQYREQREQVVRVVLLSDISPSGAPDSSQIEAWIDAYAATHTRLRYICLLGDPEYLPSIFVAENDLGEPIFGDIGYGIIGPEDESNYFRPEVFVGRIPIREHSELTRYLEKVEAFEEVVAFRDAPLFWGWEGEISLARDSHAPLLESFGYSPQVLVEPTESELFGNLNANPFRIPIVFYYSHGSSASNPPLDVSNLADWENSEWPAIYFSGGCSFLNDTPITADRSLGNAALFETGGSVATIGDPTVGGGYGYGYSFIPATIEALQSAMTIGELYYWAHEDTVSKARSYGQDTSIGSWSYLFTKRFSLRGDPGLQLNFTQAAASSALN